MKTIEDRAHEILLKLVDVKELHKVKTKESACIIAKNVWNIAEAMQAEAEKRKVKGDARSLTKDEKGNCLHFHHEFGHKKCMDCDASLKDKP